MADAISGRCHRAKVQYLLVPVCLLVCKETLTARKMCETKICRNISKNHTSHWKSNFLINQIKHMLFLYVTFPRHYSFDCFIICRRKQQTDDWWIESRIGLCLCGKGFIALLSAKWFEDCNRATDYVSFFVIGLRKQSLKTHHANVRASNWIILELKYK